MLRNASITEHGVELRIGTRTGDLTDAAVRSRLVRPSVPAWPAGRPRHRESCLWVSARELTMVCVTEDGSGLSVRQTPRRRSSAVEVADFTMMVRVPGRPTAIRVFTEDERAEANEYAVETGGTVVELHLDKPDASPPQ